MLEEKFYKQKTLPDLISKETLPSIPDKIGPYKIEGLLTKGGMSLLYLGIHPETHQTLAIKVLSPSYVTHPEAVERFLKEAQIIGLASHPNIVKLYGQGEWEGGLYIAMEFIRGISLTQFIAQHSFSLKKCIDIILQVAYALLHLHTHGVIHRDLKPENILITEDGEIKVIDFGIAQLHEEVKTSRAPAQVLGTPSYMSPEQKEDAALVTYASDIYSLGVIAYELAVGKLSFGIINLSLLPKGFQKIIGKMLALSLGERYQDIVDLITDLSNYLKSEELEKDRPGSDQVKEIVEELQKASNALLPSETPSWEELEVGLSKHKGPGQMGLYYDFFHFPNNSYVILIGEPTSSGIQSSIYTALFRGIVRTLVLQRQPSNKEVFRVVDFMTTLNRLLVEDSLRQPFVFALLLLDPLREQLAYLSCGLGRLVHLPQGVNSTPRFIGSQNSPIGTQMPVDFAETIDNWKTGDSLFFHSLETAFPNEESARKELETKLSLAISENALLSSERQADLILKKMTALAPLASQRTPKLMISIRRLS